MLELLYMLLLRTYNFVKLSTIICNFECLISVLHIAKQSLTIPIIKRKKLKGIIKANHIQTGFGTCNYKKK